MSDIETGQEAPAVEIRPEPQLHLWLVPWAGQIWLGICVPLLVFSGLREIVRLTPLFAAAVACIVVIDLYCTHRATTLSDDGVILHPLRRWRFERTPSQFGWSEVKEIRRSAFPGPGNSPILVMLDRPHTFWTLKPPETRVWIPDGVARSPCFIELARKHVPAANISGDALSGEPGGGGGLSLLSRAVIGISALTVAGCAVRLGLGVGGLGIAVLLVGIAAAGVGGRASSALLGPTTNWAAGCLFGTASGVAILLVPLWATVGFGGSASFFVGAMAAAAGFLFAVACLTPRAPPVRPRRAGLCYAFALIAGVVGYLGYGGIPRTRVAIGELSYVITPWTPTGDAFLVFRPSSDRYHGSTKQVSTKVRWYAADLTPGNQLDLPGYPRLRCVGADAALVTIAPSKRGEPSELWWLPRQSGKARRLLAADSLDIFAMDLPGTTAVLRVGNGERQEWQRCNLARAELAPTELPVRPDEVKNLWTSDNGALRWLIGSVPGARKRRRISPRARAAGESVFADDKRPLFLADEPTTEPARRFEIWEWQAWADTAPKRIYQAETIWDKFKMRDHPTRLYARRIKSGGRKRAEHIQVDVFGGVPVIATVAKEVYKRPPWQIAGWRLTAIRPPDSTLVFAPFSRLGAINTATGERRLLRKRVYLFPYSRAFWSPTGESFLYTSHTFRRWLRWKRDPELDDELTDEVYIVNLAGD